MYPPIAPAPNTHILNLSPAAGRSDPHRRASNLSGTTGCTPGVLTGEITVDFT
jgi:hypothetical protein